MNEEICEERKVKENYLVNFDQHELLSLTWLTNMSYTHVYLL